MEPSEATIRILRGAHMALMPAARLCALHEHYVWCEAEAKKAWILAKQLRQEAEQTRDELADLLQRSGESFLVFPFDSHIEGGE